VGKLKLERKGIPKPPPPHSDKPKAAKKFKLHGDKGFSKQWRKRLAK
jgi:hypothetical protein